MERVLSGMLPEFLLVDWLELDLQHEDLFCRIESLKTLCFESEEAPLLEFERLLGFFKKHFSTEEALANEAGLDFSRHARIHQNSLLSLSRALAEVGEGARDRHSFLRYVEFWLERHIRQEDKPFADELLLCGRRQRPARQISARL